MVINQCDVASDIDWYYNLTSYAKEPCSSEDVIEENIEKVRILYKAVQNTFSPEFFAENKHQAMSVTARGE